ncbi:uncharacterized protein TRIVIDRAFT_122720, partial [Trichoderma virens Gv29-8]
MGLKQFNQDIAASKTTDINGVSNIQRGDSDGEVVFTWSSSDTTLSLDIRVLSDVDSYPKGSSVMIFTDSEHSAVDVPSLLERLSASLANKNIQTVIKAVADKLFIKVETSAEADGNDAWDADSDDALGSFDEEELESEYEDDMDDDYTFQSASSRPPANQLGESSLSSIRLKKDLRTAQSAGISVGIFPRRPLREAEFFSLSLRASKLGIPEHALEAWGLEPHDYVVLLCRFPSPYPPISKLLSDNKWKPQFRFGKCSTPKPSISTARFALSTSSGAMDDKAKDASGSFMPLYISNSINMLMNHEFLALLKIRRGESCSWDGALNRFKVRTMGGSPADANMADANILDNDTSDPPVSKHAIPSLSHDYALDQDEDFSLAMVAMQLALRRFARCTKYCMVCHQRLEDEFEALKPYICYGPLCAYQFTTLGLGASIEHEIVSNPYVVDILVSFFAAALGSPKSLRNFPVGLGMKCIYTGVEDKAAVRIAAEACFYDRTIRFGPDAYGMMNPKIRVGDSLMVVVGGSDDIPVASLLQGDSERHNCKVTDIVANLYKFDVLTTFTTPLDVLPLREDERPTEISNAKREWKKVIIFQYSYDIDNLNETNRSAALVKGLPPQWMQFRFLQGTPERENLFMKEVTAVSQSKGEQSKFPTIFAWHGSSLQNWHSIIRTGLDFNTVQNGRAYGDGVYMSNDFLVSLGYCRKNPLAEVRWQNSMLKPSAAISICEVVNRCDQFVKVAPHYVVNQIEWIQCRYLFVSVDPTPEATRQPFPTKPRETCTGHVPQQPSRSLTSTSGVKVNIPLSALPSNRRQLGQSSNTVDGLEPSKALNPPEISFDSDHGETDHELLLDSEEDDADDDTTRSSTKRRSSSMDSMDKRSHKLSSAAYAQKMPSEDAVVRLTTEFVPGSLDLGSLPKLPDPSWASTAPTALKSLNRAIKELHEIQLRENLTSLGWYIDFEKISNIFHWTVELHSFELELPLAQDMKKRGCTSVVLEFRFGANFPFSPPFVRVIRPRFLPYARGGGGHVTAGGAICSEMLTNSGWSAVMTMEKVLLQIRLGLEEREPPARLDPAGGMNNIRDYGIGEAVDAYQRAARSHGWAIPEDLTAI